jgi:NADPH:quinone reductase-like Zn-dependent oxidoreductase
VEAVGANVEQFQPGDEVFGYANGAFAEYALAKGANLVPKPPNRSFEQAAAVPVAGLTALQAFRYAAELRSGIQPGDKVLVQGASGGVGVFAVQLAKSYGAEVTAVCSTRNLGLARAIGADHVIDYTRQDFTRGGEQYDLILGVNGYHSLSAYKHSLRPQGVYVCVGGSLTQIFQAILLGSLMSRGGDKKLGNMGIAKINHADLAELGELLEAGIIAPVIDCSYPLSEIVEAMRYIEETHVQGKVAITMA